jgi:hypothetical protein
MPSWQGLSEDEVDRVEEKIAKIENIRKLLPNTTILGSASAQKVFPRLALDDHLPKPLSLQVSPSLFNPLLSLLRSLLRLLLALVLRQNRKIRRAEDRVVWLEEEAMLTGSVVQPPRHHE